MGRRGWGRGLLGEFIFLGEGVWCLFLAALGVKAKGSGLVVQD